MTALRIDVTLRDVPVYGAHVARYANRGPLSGFLIAGEHGASNVDFRLGTSGDATPERAEAEAVAAEQFAAWAADHAAACREHADRV